MPTAEPTRPAPNPATRVRDALRGVRLAYRGDSIPLNLRRTLGVLEVAVEAMLAEHDELLQRVAVAREGAQATVDSSELVASRLRLVRAHLELAREATVAKGALDDETAAAPRVHIVAALATLRGLGVEAPSAADLAARAEAAITDPDYDLSDEVTP